MAVLPSPPAGLVISSVLMPDPAAISSMPVRSRRYASAVIVRLRCATTRALSSLCRLRMGIEASTGAPRPCSNSVAERTV